MWESMAGKWPWRAPTKHILRKIKTLANCFHTYQEFLVQVLPWRCHNMDAQPAERWQSDHERHNSGEGPQDTVSERLQEKDFVSVSQKCRLHLFTAENSYFEVQELLQSGMLRLNWKPDVTFTKVPSPTLADVYAPISSAHPTTYSLSVVSLGITKNREG